MNNQKLKELSLEELKKRHKALKVTLGILAGVIAILVVLVVFVTKERGGDYNYTSCCILSYFNV